jgi:hypothetical protein
MPTRRCLARSGQSRTMPAGALNRPRPQHRMRGGELHQGLIALRSRLHRQLTQHPHVRAPTAAALWVCTWVPAPMTTSTISDRLVMRSSPCRRDVPGSRPAQRRQDCDETGRRSIAGGQAPDQAKTPTGPGPVTTRTSPGKDTKSVSRRVTLAVTGPQPSSYHQAAKWILTVSRCAARLCRRCGG